MSGSTTANVLEEKPVNVADATIFPEPEDHDFDEDIGEDERDYYKTKFKDLNDVKNAKLHCSACDRHLGCAAKNETRMRQHPMLRTLVCHTCHTFYNSGEFEKGDDGSELYCRWCGQGGQVYCCSTCPHVFCAKCIKRNLGTPKIKEIESTDDWKCFRCHPRAIWDLRSLCWALLRYCDLKNKLAYKTQDAELKEKYQKECAIDTSQCCKDKRKKAASMTIKRERKNVEEATKKPSIISKLPPSIQVKKFASISNDDSIKTNKKSLKRPGSPIKAQQFGKIAIPNINYTKTANSMQPPPSKKIRYPATPIIVSPLNSTKAGQTITYQPRIRPRPAQLQNRTPFNGYNSIIPNDNINLSLENLTQGLDMAAVAAMAKEAINNDDVVCTPDFPLEPLCEVTEDNNDDDVECITPGPVAAPKIAPPPLICRTSNNIPDLSPENIIQMTENDVTVNAATGGLKFRVDPQTLSSNKMYRLPDGRIFAINANPNMPGGYSATIVAVTETTTNSTKQSSRGATYAAKLSAVVTQTSTPSGRSLRNRNASKNTPASAKTTPASTKKSVTKVTKPTSKNSRECDMSVPVEWYRFNLIEAIDSLEYSLSRLQRLKGDATTAHLRSRNVNEMRTLHRSLERLLNNSASRFHEVRDNLNKGFKEYLLRKGNHSEDDDDDDDVEILPNDNDDPIFIDENSVDSNVEEVIPDVVNTNEVDLLSSDHNDSSEKGNEKSNVHGDDNSSASKKTPDEDNEEHKDNSADDNTQDKSLVTNDGPETLEIHNSNDSNKAVSAVQTNQDEKIPNNTYEKNDTDEKDLTEEKNDAKETEDKMDTNHLAENVDGERILGDLNSLMDSIDEEMITDDQDKPNSHIKNVTSVNENDETTNNMESVDMREVNGILESSEANADSSPGTPKLSMDPENDANSTNKLQDNDMTVEMIESLLGEDSEKKDIEKTLETVDESELIIGN